MTINNVLKARNYLRKFKNKKLPKFKNLSVELDHLLGFLHKTNVCWLKAHRQIF